MTEATVTPLQEASLPTAVLGRRGMERLDLLLLTVESLDFNGGEAMLWATQQLGFESLFPNRIEVIRVLGREDWREGDQLHRDLQPEPASKQVVVEWMQNDQC